ncbi:MAG: acyl carrier protein [Alphaproteobacteria bacterium]
MTRDDIRALVESKLKDVAPEIGGEPIAPDESFRDQFELDSMDFLNFITALHEATGLEFPEADYPRLMTVGGCVDYIAGHSR